MLIFACQFFPFSNDSQSFLKDFLWLSTREYIIKQNQIIVYHYLNSALLAISSDSLFKKIVVLVIFLINKKLVTMNRILLHQAVNLVIIQFVYFNAKMDSSA